MKFYKRHIAQVINRQNRRKSTLIVTGPRQVGKSTILKKTLGDVKYVTLDDPILRMQALEDTKAFLAENKPPIIVDKIQKAPSIFDYIKMEVDVSETPGQYYLSGSHSFDLMKGVTESLAGRAGIIKMLGLSLREINEVQHAEAFVPTDTHFSKLEAQAPDFHYNTIVEIIHKGSYPELYKTESDLKDWRDYYSSYLQSYLEKDVKDLINAENMSAFLKFIQGTAALSGEQLNIQLLGEICGKNANTVKRWLSILEMSGHIYLLQSYHSNQNKRLIKTPKLYFLDTGLVCYLGGWNTPQQLTSGARWGHIFETYVVSEILKTYYNDGIVNPKLFYYRDKDKREIDMIIEEGDTLFPIEIKVTTAPDKGMVASFEVVEKQIKKSFSKGALICMYDKTISFGDKCYVINPNLV